MKKIILSLIILCFANFAFAQWTGTNPVYFNSGNVGIGVSSPDIWFSSNPLLQMTGSRPVISLNSTGSLATISFTNNAVNSSTHYGEFHINHSFSVSTPELSQLLFSSYPGGVNLTLQSDGNVGIGTISPTAKLDIRGDLKIVNSGAESSTASFWAQGTGNAGVFFDASNGDGMGSDYGSLLQKDYLGIELTNYGANPIHLLTAGAYRLTVTGSGYVGIGTTSPTEKLSVNGTVLAKKVRVSTAGADWPDFVFAPNYKLRTLNELEAYIKTNQHLPEVPSAKEVKENGLDLGKMDATLLQKVEELTLYLIEMNKRVEKLEKENLKLKKGLENK